MNLREQLERATASAEGPGQESPASAARRALVVLALGVLVTFGLGPTGGWRSTGELLGALATNVLVLAGMGVVLRALCRDIYASRRAFALLALELALVIVVAGAALRIHPAAPELVPIALVGVVTSALFDRRVSLATVVFLAALLATQPALRDTPAFPVLLAAGGVAAFVVRPTSQRDQSYVWMLVIAVATALAIVGAGVASGMSWPAIAAALARGAGTTIVSVIGAMLLMPFAESFTGRQTHLTLLEWGDLNRPLLQRLSLEAPGTYAHTIAIANLAEAAARAIGANALLARVGAYYHDIGKLAKPQYFVENQPRGRNLHDKLKPHTSATIIRNHVRDGLAFAEGEHVPASIRAFIAEHHGTGTISYFLEKAREREGQVANPADYAYAGPIPQTAETAIVMLADAVEAATRALADPTPERIREVIELMVHQRLEQGQLRDAPLTLRELTLVKDEFARVLGGMYHGRVDYPASTPTIQAAVS
ncbi:MAG TPA: HDIG domain-containing protein [Gemmatimonadaceae bacterium]